MPQHDGDAWQRCILLIDYLATKIARPLLCERRRRDENCNDCEMFE
jgi:hypothetical protein